MGVDVGMGVGVYAGARNAPYVVGVKLRYTPGWNVGLAVGDREGDLDGLLEVGE